MRVVRTAFWCLLVVVTIVYVAPRLGDSHVASRIGTLHPAWLALAGAILALHYGLIFTLWVLLLRALGCKLPRKAAFRAFSLSLLPKYVPGKVVSQGLRVRLAAEAGAPLLPISTSLVLEMALGIGSAGVVALLGLARGVPAYLAQPARWLATALGVGSALLLALLLAPSRATRWKQRIGLIPSVATAVRLGALLAGYTGGWAIAAMAHWALARAIQPLPLGAVVPLGMALAISWGVGALSVFAPAGLGVKDAVLYLSVRGLLGDQNALIFAGLSRTLSVAVEIVITAGYWASAWGRRGAAGAESAGRRAPVTDPGGSSGLDP